jgi:serine/threonine protein kinase
LPLFLLIRPPATKDEDKVRFLKEAAIMAQFSHPNIVGLVGVCTLPPTEPTLIVLEYMHLGSLHGYLQSPMVKDQLETLTMLRMALDIGSAMQYLAEAAFVVRWCPRKVLSLLLLFLSRT